MADASGSAARPRKRVRLMPAIVPAGAAAAASAPSAFSNPEVGAAPESAKAATAPAPLERDFVAAAMGVARKKRPRDGESDEGLPFAQAAAASAAADEEDLEDDGDGSAGNATPQNADGEQGGGGTDGDDEDDVGNPAGFSADELEIRAAVLDERPEFAVPALAAIRLAFGEYGAHSAPCAARSPCRLRLVLA